MKLALIAAVSLDGIIGQGGKMPWEGVDFLKQTMSTDLRRFQRLTINHPVIMGRKTYESIVDRNGRPLDQRQNIVVTASTRYGNAGTTWIARTVEEAIGVAQGMDNQACVIGGEQIYRATIDRATHLYITRIKETFPNGDTFFPQFSESEWECTFQEDHKHHTFLSYKRR